LLTLRSYFKFDILYFFQRSTNIECSISPEDHTRHCKTQTKPRFTINCLKGIIILNCNRSIEEEEELSNLKFINYDVPYAKKVGSFILSTPPFPENAIAMYMERLDEKSGFSILNLFGLRYGESPLLKMPSGRTFYFDSPRLAIFSSLWFLCFIMFLPIIFLLTKQMTLRLKNRQNCNQLTDSDKQLGE
jgi:hypothetical protein